MLNMEYMIKDITKRDVIVRLRSDYKNLLPSRPIKGETVKLVSIIENSIGLLVRLQEGENVTDVSINWLEEKSRNGVEELCKKLKTR